MGDSPQEDASCYLAGARLLVRRGRSAHTVVSAARGGVFKHFPAAGPAATDAGLIVETSDGRVAVSQMLDLGRGVEVARAAEGTPSGEASAPAKTVRPRRVARLNPKAANSGACR